MIKVTFYLSAFLLFGSIACSDDDSMDQHELQALTLDGDMEADANKLDSLKSAIENLAQSVSCVNDLGWSFTPMGSKACGGPQYYLAYHNSIDVEDFLSDVEIYKLTEEAFNVKWEVISTCDAIAEPTGVECNNGEAKLIYSF